MRDKSNWTKNQNNPNGLSFSCMYVNVEDVLPEVQRCRVIIWKVGRAAECDGLENRLG